MKATARRARVAGDLVADHRRPGPVTRLTTPGGRSASAMHSASATAHTAVVGAGVQTTVLPQASAGRQQLGGHRVRPVPGRDDPDGPARAAHQHHALAGRERVRQLAAEPLGVLGRRAPVLDQLVDLVVGLGAAAACPGRASACAPARRGGARSRRRPRASWPRARRRSAATSRSNARLAASIARWASERSPCGTVPIVSPVAGLVVSAVSPEAAGTHSPSTNIDVGHACTASARRLASRPP